MKNTNKIRGIEVGTDVANDPISMRKTKSSAMTEISTYFIYFNFLEYEYVMTVYKNENNINLLSKK